MSNQTEKNLPSIITRPVQPGDERSGATNKYVAKKSLTFNAEEIQEVLLTLQEKKDDPYATLHGVGIALLYFGQLRAIVMADVDLNDGKKKITVKFTHKQK